MPAKPPIKPPTDQNQDGVSAPPQSNAPTPAVPKIKASDDDEEVTFSVQTENPVLGGEMARQARKEKDESRLAEYEQRVKKELNSSLNLKNLKKLSEEMDTLQSRHIPEDQKKQLAVWTAQTKAEIQTRENNRSRGTWFVAGVTAFFNAFMTGNFSGAWSIAKTVSQKVWDEGLNRKDAFNYAARESASLAAANIIADFREKKLKDVSIGVAKEPPKVVPLTPSQTASKGPTDKPAQTEKPKKAPALTTQFSAETPPKDEPAPGGAHKKPQGPIANLGSVPPPEPPVPTPISPKHKSS